MGWGLGLGVGVHGCGKLVVMEEASGESQTKPKGSRKKFWVALAIVLVLLIVAGVGLWAYTQRYTGPFPADIRAKANFDLYYPDSAKLPPGYSLDKSSFTYAAEGPAVLYSVKFDDDQKWVFSIQPKPDSDAMEQFLKTQIPLHLETITPVGRAYLGAIKEKSVNSLPTDGNSWIIVTGPIDHDQEKLKLMLKALVIDS